MEASFFQLISLFSKAASESLEKLSQIAKRHFYKKGTLILNTKEAAHTFLYVMNGWIKVFRESAEGEEVIVDVLTNDHYCGEAFIFHPSLKDSYIAQAISDIEIFTIPMQALKQLVLSDQQISLNFLEASLKKQQELNMEIEHLSIQNAEQRIGCFFLRLCSLEEGKDVSFHLPYDKVLLASRLGMRAETFSRALAKLCERCHIEVKGDFIHIQNRDLLVKYICQHCSKTFPCESKS